MSHGVTVAVATAILALIIGCIGLAGYAIGGLTGRWRWEAPPFASFLARYALAFGLLLGLETLFLWALPTFHHRLCESVAAAAAALLRITGTDASVSGSVISIGDPSLLFDVSVACLGGVLLWVYLALVSAENTASLGQRFKGMLVGLGILSGFNFLRVALSVYLEGVAGLRVHDYFYLVNILFVLLVWAGWLRTLKGNRQPHLPLSHRGE